MRDSSSGPDSVSMKQWTIEGVIRSDRVAEGTSRVAWSRREEGVRPPVHL